MHFLQDARNTGGDLRQILTWAMAIAALVAICGVCETNAVRGDRCEGEEEEEEECCVYRYMVVLIVLLLLLYCHSQGAVRHPPLPMYTNIYPWLTSLACLASVAIRANGKG
jgi:hypothetical protein